MIKQFLALSFVLFTSFGFVQDHPPIRYSSSHISAEKNQPEEAEEPHAQYLKNKNVPSLIRGEVAEVLAFFPELADVQIDFVFKKKINKCFMQAQPKWYGFFQSKSKRDYVIKISRSFQLEGSAIPIEEMPSDVLKGWFAHELGHIMDYQDRSAFSLMKFGFSYITSRKYMMEAERTADVKAIHCNLGEYLLSSKNFILNHTDIPLEYKEKINRFYMSAEEATELIDNLPEDMFTIG